MDSYPRGIVTVLLHLGVLVATNEFYRSIVYSHFFITLVSVILLSFITRSSIENRKLRFSHSKSGQDSGSGDQTWTLFKEMPIGAIAFLTKSDGSKDGSIRVIKVNK